jgi:hypothetical protein
VKSARARLGSAASNSAQTVNISPTGRHLGEVNRLWLENAGAVRERFVRRLPSARSAGLHRAVDTFWLQQRERFATAMSTVPIMAAVRARRWPLLSQLLNDALTRPARTPGSSST